jgi:hypothetical protein
VNERYLGSDRGVEKEMGKLQKMKDSDGFEEDGEVDAC